MQTWRKFLRRTKPVSKAETGFTLVEILITVAIVGILVGISAPSFLGLLERQRLISANNQVYQAMRQAQNKAKRERAIWQVSFQEQGGVAQWAVHRANVAPSNWNSSEYIQIDDSNTTLSSPPDSSRWRVQFNFEGHVNGQLGRITLNSKQNNQAKRCIVISTLLGAMRTEQGAACE